MTNSEVPQGKEHQEEPPPAATKQQAQIDLILREFEGAAGVDPPDWRESGVVRYLYRRGSILVRDADLPRVREVFGGAGDVQDSLVNGVTRFAPPMPTLEALDAIEAALGIGVASPDHVLSICPVLACPATEPEEVPGSAEPDPEPPASRYDGRGVLVSVVDSGWLTGADQQHAWLQGVDGDPETVLDAQNHIRPYAGHGTFIAGVLRGTAPKAEIFVEGALTTAGATFESELVRQLDDAVSRSPDVLSLSLGTRTRNELGLIGFDALYENRLRHIKGLVVVAAAGNDGDRGPFWPAAYPWAVSVGALSATWRSRASFSNYGRWVDVYAPGEGLVNAYATGTYVCNEPPNAGAQRVFDGMARWSGTSFSTPLVAGLIAARMSVTGENGRQAADALLRHARTQAVPGVGAVLYPEDACGGHCGHTQGHSHCGHGHGHGDHGHGDHGHGDHGHCHGDRHCC
jgi:subtilisin family serine protease